MKFLRLFIVKSLVLIIPLLLSMNTQAAEGKILGGADHVAPDWFKESFLEIQEDVEEAVEENKHVMLFFQLNGCPYCDRMLRESFETDPYSSYIQDHFDVIAVNVRGDREIAFNEEVSVTEKELSEILNVRATPAIVILDENNKTVVRVNGYRAPERFKKIMQYVETKAYKKGIKLSQYLDKNLAKNVYVSKENKLFSKLSDLSAVKGPLALIFEDGSCYECNELYEGMLSREDVLKELKLFTLVRINVDRDESITDVDGERLTLKALAQKYTMMYRPGVLIFNEGELQRRYDSLMFSHHFKEGLRFVSGKHYQNGDYSLYSSIRTQQLLSDGVDIDLSASKK